MQKKPRKGEEFWRAQCSGWEQSNLTQADYCSVNKLNVKTFGRWRGHFKHLQPAPAITQNSKRSSKAFIPVRLTSSAFDGDATQPISRGEIRLRLSSSPWIVDVQTGIETSALVEVLRAVVRASE